MICTNNKIPELLPGGCGGKRPAFARGGQGGQEIRAKRIHISPNFLRLGVGLQKLQFHAPASILANGLMGLGVSVAGLGFETTCRLTLRIFSSS